MGKKKDATFTERVWLAGGTYASLTINVGDLIQVIDVEGMQLIDMFFFDLDGRSDLTALGLEPTGNMLTTLTASLRQIDINQAANLGMLFRDKGIDADTTKGLTVGGLDNPPGSNVLLKSNAHGLLCVLVPGETNVLEADAPPPTEIELRVSRAQLEDSQVPAPLAEPKSEIRIKAGTAQAYQVTAGEYIQVIDVEGKQCSDFLAFDASDLVNGVESTLDATTTRTLVGNVHPMPGLYSKYFDQNMHPLVEVVRDTVGRHDNFTLACSAKYYEDLGYPGHANCTENFNSALAPHGVAARRGWPAINFFYNTAVDHSGTILSGEPWSRPGDYVLLRALSDLVCASSSCADDVSAANDWNPTDIHVRIYDHNQSFSKGIVTRMTPDTQPKLTRETAFHPRTSQLTRNFSEYRSYWLPTCFSSLGPITEYWACRERVAIMDLSPLRKFEVVGPDAEVLFQTTFTRDVSKLAVGQVVYGAMCYDHGGMIDDGTLFRLSQTNFRWVCGEEFTGNWLREQAAQHDLKVWVKSSSDFLHNCAVQGPKSREVLSKLIWTHPAQPKLTELKWFRFTIGRLGDEKGIPLLVSRTGYTGELGYEIWCHPKDAIVVWDAVIEAGQPFGLIPLGLAALDMLRIEAGLAFSGYEFCDQTDPFEAGIGFCVSNKAADYIGKKALIERKAHPQRKLVGLIFDSNEAIYHDDPVYVGRAQVGSVTSATYSPKLERWIALSHINVSHANIGEQVEIGKLDGRQKRIAATVVRFPHYDPDKSRVRV